MLPAGNMHTGPGLLLALWAAVPALALLTANETATSITLENDRIKFGLEKSSGYMTTVNLDGVNLLGERITSTNAIGPYLDGIFSADQKLVSVGSGGTYSVIQGTDTGGVKWAGVVITNDSPRGDTGLVAQQYWFLRETETSLHGFTRLAYHNEAAPKSRVLTELRTLFRPHSSLWTHMSSADDFWVPQPKPNPAVDSKNDLGTATLVQDTTWYLANRTNDPYVTQVADYWTKYTMSETYRDHTVHGILADGSTSNGSTFGAWMVYNSKDTFLGGPTYSDLTVDGIVYNYIQSNHHGDQPPNITHGFDRTWGPSIYHFNRGSAGGDVGSSLSALRNDAKKMADISQHTAFYDSIAPHVTGYVPKAGRGSWQAHVKLPKGASNPIAVLSAPGFDYQDNAMAPSAYQYWANVDKNGKVQIDRVKAGTYRLTLYGDGVFGDFVASENIVVAAGKTTDSKSVDWVPESAGTELWRIGVPDKSAGEFRHGYAPSDRGLRVPQYRVYWGAYDFVNDFPQGVKFAVGKSKEAEDWNYVHWASFGSSMTRPGIVSGPTISNWTITFDLDKNALMKRSQATFTVQFAGVTTDAGNTDVFNPNSPWSNLEFGVVVNGNKLQSHIIPYYHSGSCATRSGITCYTERAKFVFPTSYLNAGSANEMVLVLPFNATGTAVVPTSINVMYDALRLEVQ